MRSSIYNYSDKFKNQVFIYFLHFSEYTDMCTGNFFEHASAVGNHEPRPASGTRCAGPCIYDQGRWGSSYCYTEDGNWGAECVACPSK